MCGICGGIRRDPDDGWGFVSRLSERLRHRGPDGQGQYAEPQVCLAMRRLSIIDLAGGAQPLFNEDRSLVLVANGEIYNYLELREELAARGHRLSSHSDVEPVLHLYEEHGTDLLQHLRGMFAFALWDKRRRRLMLARDRMGEKPLYLVESPGCLYFASELKALVGAGVVPVELDEAAIHDYFHLGYIPEPRTALHGVRKLPAGTWMTIEPDSWRVQEHRYWEMADAPPIESDPVPRIRRELESIAQIVIRADVPVGVALSGGLDSSAVAALAVQAQQRAGATTAAPVHAFSVGYPGRPRYDERSQAAELAAALGLRFHEIEIAPDDMVRAFPDLVWQRDDPIADISGHGYYALAQAAAAEGVPVLLQGQGGDELFWGYPWVAEAAAEATHVDASSAARFYDRVPHFRDARVHLKQYAGAALQGAARDGLDSVARVQRGADGPVRLTSLICRLYLRENGLTQLDRLSMAASVEPREPLVDHRLVETVVGLRKHQPDHRLPPKAWLKEAVADLLPEAVLLRPKQGFAPPLHTWHRLLFAAYGRWLPGGELVERGVLSREGAGELAGGPFPEGVVVPISFKALVLEAWCRAMSACRRGARPLDKHDADRRLCLSST